MLSICIPIYNFNIIPLVRELHLQAGKLEEPIEFLLIDDCSSNFKAENKAFCSEFTYIELPENIGRSRIRNQFLSYAKYEYLLFLDCDALIGSSLFLENYIDALKSKPKVICGGRVYDSKRPDKNHLLRWKYGIYKESQSSEQRNKAPNKSFMTNNFVIERELFASTLFDERIGKYGHEDTLFGFALSQKNSTIHHIENPVINGDVETNKEFLRKTEEGVANLVNILRFVNQPEELASEITLLQFHKRIKPFEAIVYGFYRMTKKPILRLLKKGYIYLPLFDFYKLGYFIECKKNIRND